MHYRVILKKVSVYEKFLEENKFKVKNGKNLKTKR